MDQEIMQGFRQLDFMGVEFLLCRNINRLVETDMTYFRLKDSKSPARPFFVKVMGNYFP